MAHRTPCEVTPWLNRIFVGAAVAVALLLGSPASAPLAQGPSPDQDFQARCSAPGVTKCVSFDTTGTTDIGFADPPIVYCTNDRTPTGTFQNASGCNVYPNRSTTGQIRAKLDTNQRASGAGSLRFDLMPNETADIAGQWGHNAAPFNNIGTTVQPGQTFYYQWRQRFSPNMMALKCNTPGSSCWTAAGGGHTGWKIGAMFFNEGGGACHEYEFTHVHHIDAAFPNNLPVIYSACGQQPIFIDTGGGNFYLQQRESPITAQGGTTAGWNCLFTNVNSSNCLIFPTNAWMTFYTKITHGDFGVPNSRVESWVALPGETFYRKWIDTGPNWVINSCSPGNCSTPAAQQGLNSFTFLPYMTGLQAVNTPLENASAGCASTASACTWVDELIFSRQPIAVPGGAATVSVPQPPKNLTLM